MADLVQMIGKTFARLTVAGAAPRYIDGSGRPRLKYVCSCTCGKSPEILGENLRSGHTTSCGCVQAENRKKRRLEGLIGERYGRLVIVSDEPPYITSQGKEQRMVKVKCDCGNDKVVKLNSLRRGISSSCGCYRTELAIGNITHGEAGPTRLTREYKTWANMIARCENPKVERYPSYGGRGIKVCKDWRENFEIFLSDMGRKPTLKHSIDRIDVNGNYEPGNCRWATNSEQQLNKRPRA